MRQAAARQAAAGSRWAAERQRRGVEGAETTGSLRAFSRGTPRMIALKEEAWYRALTLQTFRAFECVVPIMRDRKKLSATRSLSAPSVRQRTSADETLAFWESRYARKAA